MVIVIHSSRRIYSEVVDKLRNDVASLGRSLKGCDVGVKISRRASCFEDLGAIAGH